MKSSKQTCDADRLEAYLSGDLSFDEQQDVERHLDVCTVCQHQIDQLAAEPDSWHEASELLGNQRWQDEDGHRSFETESDRELAASKQIQLIVDSLAPTDDPAMLGRLGSYEIRGVIGNGGMGAVLKGFDRSLDRVVAIKLMAPHLASSAVAKQRFRREAQAAAAITHDNVIDIYGVSESDGLPYLVMPYARGPSLQRRLNECGALPLVEVLRIGCQIAAGLAAAHDQGLVHRDIKPANVLMNDGIERLVITDFGLARAVDDASVTRTGVLAGTPQYMSPEQARGDAVDHRSDLFSLGSLLYTACTGRPPFRSDTAYGILRMVTDSKPLPIRELNPAIPEWLCRVIDKLHAKDASDRYQSAGAVAKLLQQCLAHVQTANTPLPDSITSHGSYRPVKVLIAATLSIAVTVGAFQMFRDSSRNASASVADEETEREASSTFVINPPISSPAADKPTLPEGFANEFLKWDDASVEDAESIKQRAVQLTREINDDFGKGPYGEREDED